MPEKRKCPVCGELFTVPPTHKNQKYCSPDCSVVGGILAKERAGKNRVNTFIESLPDLQIVDVLSGRLEKNTTNNRMTVRGARTWENKKFIILVVD